MRLPKFRCKNKIGNWCFFTVLHGGNVNEENFDLETLSQFTGLSDKHGVDIYEGDILKCWLKYQSYKPTFIEDVKVIDLDNTLPFSREFNIENKTYKDRVGECEVIGNIYENPELLESK